MKTVNELRKILKGAKAQGCFENYRITKDNEVHLYGTMPNTDQTGWYLAGNISTPCGQTELLRWL